MARIQRPTIETNIRPVSALLNEPLRRIVTLLAQRLKRPEPEPVDVAVMRLNVIADLRRSDDAALETELAQWVLEKLMPSDPSPACGAVPPIPLRRPATDAHGSNYHPLAETPKTGRCAVRSLLDARVRQASWQRRRRCAALLATSRSDSLTSCIDFGDI